MRETAVHGLRHSTLVATNAMGVSIACNRLLRASTVIAVPVGALGSVGFVLLAGHRNDSRILLALFAFWVFSPFMALAWAGARSRNWSVPARVVIDSVTLVLTLGALAVYGVVALGAPRARPAFMFLVVPLASWPVIALAATIAAAKAHIPPNGEKD